MFGWSPCEREGPVGVAEDVVFSEESLTRGPDGPAGKMLGVATWSRK